MTATTRADADSSSLPADERLPDRPAASLSPSRAGDFMACPLKYRFRVVDQLPEQPGPEAARGTVVHTVLELLFDLPSQQRHVDAAQGLVPQAWQRLIADQPELPGLLFGGEDAWAQWLETGRQHEPDPRAQEAFLAECGEFVSRYFRLEDPTVLQPAEREKTFSVELADGLVLRGIVDRIDRAPSGAIRVVDYKTGRAPGQGWEARALFQMRFYGLMLWRLWGEPPARLELLYLGSGERISIDPTESELRATERKILALWQAIERAQQSGRWEASPSKLCDWCSYRAICPAWGGNPPPLPQ